MKTILLNGKPIDFSKQDLPLLIHGGEGTGSSLFSVSIMAQLYKQGAKILFISGYHMARDEFKEQVGPELDSILIEGEKDIAAAKDKRVIFVPFEQRKLLTKLLAELPDIGDRTIFFKNFDLFDADITEEILENSACIIQGDLTKDTHVLSYIPVHWSTEIYFSQPPEAFSSQVPELEKYTGFMVSEQKGRRGIVSLR